MRTVRNAVAVALALALQAAGLSALLVHAHPDEHATGHHAGRTVHTHFAGHTHAPAPGTTSLAAADHDRAVFLETFIAVTPSSPLLAGATEDVFDVPFAAERRPHRAFEVVHGHDPPSLRRRSSRAPPALLS